jgi:DNA-binding FrmR family transcriptional regulator
MSESKCGCCSQCGRTKHTPRSEEQKKQLDNRLNRIIGQLNGIRKMLDENRYCGDILTQIAAAESALQSMGYLILKEHMETCVAEGVRAGDNEIMAEAFELMKKLK